MDPYDRFDSRRRKINFEAIIAFVLAVVAAYLVQVTLGFGGGGIFTMLIVLAVGGLWYKVRKQV